MLNKMPGDRWQKFANLRLLLGFMMGHPGKKLNFMGYEFGQWKEWTHDTSLEWHEVHDPLNNGLQRFVREINHLYLKHSPLWDQDTQGSGFKWVDFSDGENSVCSFLRFGYDWHNCMLFVCNFTPVPRINYRVGVPHGGMWKEVINSDAVEYGGAGVGNWGGFHAEQTPWQGFEYSLNLNLPPLGCLALHWRR
jgi:1,4-alpha-glucan branching enzyme